MSEAVAQESPYPKELFDLVSKLVYRPGWSAKLMTHLDRGQGSKGLTLCIYVVGPDTYNPDTEMRVVHYMIVPAASYNRRSWQRWLLEQFLLVERHECCEFFQIDGERPYAPNHGPGHDPYIIFDHASDEERRTDYRGNLKGDAP